MGSFHWLILIPYYFFAALAAFLLLLLVSRLLRLSTRANGLVMVAIGVALGAVFLPLIGGWATLASYTALGMALLGAASFVLAALDAWLEPRIPLPLDDDMRQL